MIIEYYYIQYLQAPLFDTALWSSSSNLHEALQLDLAQAARYCARNPRLRDPKASKCCSLKESLNRARMLPLEGKL